MQCYNCGGTLYKGDAACHICGSPVIASEEVVEEIVNPATQHLIKQSIDAPAQQLPQSDYTPANTSFEAPTPSDNHIEFKDENDRTKATLYNFATFAAFIVGFIILAIYIYNAVIK